MRELESIYDETRSRVVSLVAGVDGADAVVVPACPQWTVHDVVAHLAGIGQDVLCGNVAGAATDGWTSAQVEARRGRSTHEVLAEWDDVGPRLAALLDDFPGRYGRQVIADLTVHEHDLRGALRRPGARASSSVELANDFLLGALVAPAAAALGLEPLRIDTGDHSWVVGTATDGSGDGSRDVEEAIAVALATADDPPPPPSPPASRILNVDPFDLCRALTGRRSEAQIRRLRWSDDPAAYLALFGLGPFTIRPADLEE